MYKTDYDKRIKILSDVLRKTTDLLNEFDKNPCNAKSMIIHNKLKKADDVFYKMHSELMDLRIEEIEKMKRSWPSNLPY